MLLGTEIIEAALLGFLALTAFLLAVGILLMILRSGSRPSPFF
jgi:hypothetical protein